MGQCVYSSLFPISYTKIINNIYIGDYRSGIKAINDKEPITHILSLVPVSEKRQYKYIENNITLHQYMFDDNPNENIINHFLKLRSLIYNILVIEKGTLLINCMAGRSRSVSITILTLIYFYNHTFDSAFQLINLKRKVWMNNGFYQQIKEYRISK